MGYEHPWNNLTFTTDLFIEINKKHLNKKIEALSKYESQNGLRKYFNKEYLEAWALTRGRQIDKEYAETFELIRWIIK